MNASLLFSAEVFLFGFGCLAYGIQIVYHPGFNALGMLAVCSVVETIEFSYSAGGSVPGSNEISKEEEKEARY
jgi:hypothetical protein